MKKRILEKVFAELNARVEMEKNSLAEKQSKAFSYADVSLAQSEYSKAKFDFLTGAVNNEFLHNAHLKYTKTLGEHGFCENDFEYTPHCKKCGDTGYAGGKLCSCVKKQYVIYLAKECDILSRAPFSFADCNTENMPTEQGEALKKLYAYGEEYVSKYPNVTKHILVFTGATGTGKSCLASAIARKAVLSRGKSALIRSAYELNSTFLSTHLAPVDQKNRVLHDTLTCDFLIIDDLGTEPMLKNVTLEYLQLTLDERTRNSLTTAITTNLNEKQLKERYGERIFSRLCDTKTSLIRRIPGKDLRLK